MIVVGLLRNVAELVFLVHIESVSVRLEAVGFAIDSGVDRGLSRAILLRSLKLFIHLHLALLFQKA